MCHAILHRLPVQKAFISIDGDNVTEPHLTLRQGAGFFFVLFICFTAIFTLDLYLRRKSHFSLMRCQSSCKKTDSDVSQRLFSLQPVSYQGLTSAVPCYSCLWLCVCHTLQRWASKQGASGVRRSTGTFIMALCTPPTCHTHTLDIHFLRNKTRL